MNVLRYQSQIQQQQQEAPEAAADGGDASAPGESTDDIVSDILGGDGKPPKDEPGDVQEPEPEVPADDASEDEPPADDDEPEPDDDEEEEPLAASAGDLAKARKAMADGDIDNAFRLAFGKKPEDCIPNAYAWTKWRAANDREARKRANERREHEAAVLQARNELHGERVKIGQTIEALRPYEKYYLAEQAWKRDGDPAHLVDIIQGVTGMTYDEAQKVILTKTRRSPAERAMQAKLAELEEKLARTNAEREQREQQVTAEQAYANDLQIIRQSVTGEVTKIPRFAERIYRVLDKTRGPLGLTLTVEQAAERVIRAERKRIASHPFIKKPPKPGTPAAVSTAARTLAQRRAASSPPLRRNSQNNGASTAKDESTDDIVADILGGKPKRRSA
jgi:hypothetical protein